MFGVMHAYRISLSVLIGLSVVLVSTGSATADTFKSRFQRRVVGDDIAGFGGAGNRAGYQPGGRVQPTLPGGHGKDQKIKDLLEKLAETGMDTSRLQKFFESLIRQIDTLEQPQAMPEGLEGWLVAIGAKDPPSADPEALRRWREGLKDKTRDFWIRQLQTGDHNQIIDGIKKWAAALNKFNEADQHAAQAAITSVKAHQRLTEDLASAVPLLGEGIDILAMVRGQTLSGDKTSALTYILNMARVLGPGAVNAALSRWGKKGDDAAAALVKVADDAKFLSPAQRAELAKKLGVHVDDLDDTLARLRSIGGCFLKGTLVPTADGFKPIEEINVGDFVLARDEVTGEVGYKPVLHLFPGSTQKVCRVTIALLSQAKPRQTGRTERHQVGNRSGGSDDSDEDSDEPPSQSGVQELLCTPGHEFYRANGDIWVDAAELRPGDRLIGSTGESLEVVDVAVWDEQAPTWNFEVETFHTYFVAECEELPAVWVHNNNCAADWIRPPNWILPRKGKWKGTPGNSDFIPDNPSALGLKNGDVVPFKNGMPDFSKYSARNYRVKGLNGLHSDDMPMIHAHIAKQKGWLKADGTPNANAARKWLSEQGLTPHHAGGSLVQLIPTRLHGPIKHMGGAYGLRNGG